MTTEDYRRCTQGTLSRDLPSPDDKDPERCLSGLSSSTQIREIIGQEGSGRLFYVTGIRDCP